MNNLKEWSKKNYWNKIEKGNESKENLRKNITWIVVSVILNGNSYSYKSSE